MASLGHALVYHVFCPRFTIIFIVIFIGFNTRKIQIV